MTTASNPHDIVAKLQQIETLIRQAETLSYSTEWRETAKTMRKIQQTIQSLNVLPNPEQETRLRISRQIFMDRRAAFFADGNQKKGAKLLESVSLLQQQVYQIKESIRSCEKSIASFNQQLATVDEQKHQEQIKHFIKDSIAALKVDIINKQQQLLKIENEMVEQSSRYCGGG